MSSLQTQSLVKKFNRAQKELVNGDPAIAVKLFEKLLKPSSNHVDIMYMIALAYGKMGRLDMVKQYCSRILHNAPDHPGALSNLANVLFTEGDLEGSLQNYKRAINKQPGSLNIIDNYCRVLNTIGQNEQAIDILNKCIAQNPRHAPAYAAIGVAFAETGQISKAENAFNSALTIDRNNIDANIGLGILNRLAGNLNLAEKLYKRVLDLNPYQILAYTGLATIQRLVGNHDEALTIIHEAEARLPGNIKVLEAKADILEHAGKYDQSLITLRKMREEHGILTPLAISTFANMCPKNSNCHEALELINESLEHAATNKLEKKMLFFSSGQILDKMKRYDEAFKSYKNANEAVETTFEEDKELSFVNVIKSQMTRDKLTQCSRSTYLTEKPIFIVGMPRSGTTLTETILDAHGDVHGGGELGDIGGIANAVSNSKKFDISYYASLPTLTSDTLDGYASNYLNTIDSLDAQARYVIDKMPHNFLHVGLIEMLFPNARIIHCTRDPLDNILSIYFQNFSGTHNYATNLENIARFYKAYRQVMEHWQSESSLRILTMSYDDLVQDQESMSRNLLEFCNLEWNDKVLDFHKSDRSVGTASYQQVRKPMYKSSSKRWKNYEKYLDHVKRILDMD